MIQVDHLTKKYGKLTAVDNLSLTANAGEITILLGDNGAGKSTTIKSIIGLLNYQGDIHICGFPNRSIEAKCAFSYIPEVPVLYDVMTVDEHIEFISKAYGITDNQATVEKYITLFELEDKRKTLAKELSKGMRQKLSMILALITKPQALLVDEPLIGLDPQSIENVLAMFVELKNQGVSLLLSTHIIDVIDGIWDTAYIMKKGQLQSVVHAQELQGRKLKDIFFEVEDERQFVAADKTEEIEAMANENSL